jgi:hypothetical protein
VKVLHGPHACCKTGARTPSTVALASRLEEDVSVQEDR